MSREDLLQTTHYTDRGQSFLPVIPVSSVNILENRLSNQERTTATLLEEAFKIKDNIIASSRRFHVPSQGEIVARKLLENHIQTITNIVKQLSHDIQVLEAQIRARDNVTAGTSFVVQSLDRKHLSDIGELRGRVARCDASISKLSGDLNGLTIEIKRLEKEQHNIKSSTEMHMKDLDLKISQLLSKMENSLMELNSKLKMAQGEQRHEVQNLDTKVLGLLESLNNQIQDQRKWTEMQINKSQESQAEHLNHLQSVMHEKLTGLNWFNDIVSQYSDLKEIDKEIDTTEKKTQEGINYLAINLEKAGERHKHENERDQMKKKMEEKLNVRLKRMEQEIWDELDNMKKEYRAGFQSITDSLNYLHKINDTKMKVEQQKVQKDMKHIKRKIINLKEV
ncbi:protein FAM81B [Protopterus annectens]|uniref:protein FAM81B n=1 Tax=Protopterus annectens TaxID=7888 RepID=UPI001CFA25D1|nr:protein FAM81B [Protopterus annectens]